MMVTIRVNRFCLAATIFAILPVDLIDCCNIVEYSFVYSLLLLNHLISLQGLIHFEKDKTYLFMNLYQID